MRTQTPPTPSAADAEAALLGRVAAGDERALALLYDTYARALYGWALRRLGAAELAEELVQRVMTRLWRQAGRYDRARASVRTWVFVLARSTLLDLYRRRPPPVPTAALPDSGGHGPDGVDELDALLRAEAVRAALERLSPEHRQVLDLAYYGGLTQAEIARRLSLPLGTVKSRTYYALKALRLACDELGVDG